MEEVSGALIKNAIDFLERSIKEFKEYPKYSILHFAIAIEILLKSRLLCEHWSLIVKNKPNKQKFIEGDFISVNLHETVQRLRDIVGENISDSEFKIFKKIATHRNKVIHFFHDRINTEKGLQNIIKEQCECWYYIKVLFTRKWRQYYEAYIEIFLELDYRLKNHWEYLSLIYEKKKEKIINLKNKGYSIGKCYFCSFDSVFYQLEYQNFFKGKCLVCNRMNTVLKLECECGNIVSFEDDGWGTCQACHKHYKPEDIVQYLFDPYNNPYDNSTPANCQFCDGYHTVVTLNDFFICTSCFAISQTLNQCEWCSEYYLGNIEDSYLTGCPACDGRVGWDTD